jgi:hypothetical protein
MTAEMSVQFTLALANLIRGKGNIFNIRVLELVDRANLSFADIIS